MVKSTQLAKELLHVNVSDKQKLTFRIYWISHSLHKAETSCQNNWIRGGSQAWEDLRHQRGKGEYCGPLCQGHDWVWKASGFSESSTDCSTPDCPTIFWSKETPHLPAACSTTNTELFAGCPRASLICLLRPERRVQGLATAEQLGWPVHRVHDSRTTLWGKGGDGRRMGQ